MVTQTPLDYQVQTVLQSSFTVLEIYPPRPPHPPKLNHICLKPDSINEQRRLFGDPETKPAPQLQIPALFSNLPPLFSTPAPYSTLCLHAATFLHGAEQQTKYGE